MGALRPRHAAIAADLHLLSSVLWKTPSQPILNTAIRAAPSRSISSGFPLRRDVSKSPETPSSVSQTEVSHFSRLASSWWDPYGPSRLLHLMNPLRHDFIRSCLQTSPEARSSNQKYSYLDVGCGGGIFASSAARLSTTERVTAIDPTHSVIRIAQTHQRSDPALADPQ